MASRPFLYITTFAELARGKLAYQAFGIAIALPIPATVEDLKTCAVIVRVQFRYGCCCADDPAQGFLINLEKRIVFLLCYWARQAMLKRTLLKIVALLMGSIGGLGAGWILGRGAYFLTEELSYMSEPPEIRLVHAVDGGLAFGILTYFFVMPIAGMVGGLLALRFTERNG
ncbi:MAG: hypothetical protein JNJ50_03385 [Acidobacteria bacterium]|nr:hypothetical protein [Acidobacteriota bacterium]